MQNFLNGFDSKKSLKLPNDTGLSFNGKSV